MNLHELVETKRDCREQIARLDGDIARKASERNCGIMEEEDRIFKELRLSARSETGLNYCFIEARRTDRVKRLQADLDQLVIERSEAYAKLDQAHDDIVVIESENIAAIRACLEQKEA